MATQQKKNTSKNTAAKKTAAKKKTTSKKKSSGKKKSRSFSDGDIIATCFVVAGVLFLTAALFSGAEGAFWNQFHCFWLTSAGLLGFLLPIAAIVLPIMYWLGKNMSSASKITVEAGICVIILQGLCHLIAVQDEDWTFAETLSETYNLGVSGEGFRFFTGGMPGAVLGGSLFALCRSKGIAVLLLIIVLCIAIMICFKISPRNVVDKARVPAGKIKDAGVEKARQTGEHMRIRSEQRKTEREERERRRQETEQQLRFAEEEETRTHRQNGSNGRHVFTDSNGTTFDPHRDDYPDAGYYDDDYFTQSQRNIFEFLKGNNITSTTSSAVVIPAAKKTSASVPVSSDGTDPLIKPAIKISSEDTVKSGFAVTAPAKTEQTETGDANTQPVKKETPHYIVPGMNTQIEAEPETDNLPPIIPMSEDTIPAEAQIPAKPAEKPVPLTKDEQNDVAQQLTDGMNEEQKKEYVFPPLGILTLPAHREKYYDENELRRNGEKLIEALASFNVSASISAIVPGPTVTRYELTPAPGVKISKFTGLADDLALHLAAPAGIRIEAPIPNKSAIGIEIPNRDKLTITFREVIDTPEFSKAESNLTVALGKNISGDSIFCNIAKMPHLLVAGTTGSGKSVLMNSMIVSIIYKSSPEQVRMILIDPKTVEFGQYNGIPHLLVPVVSDARKASGALNWAVTEMLDRYRLFNENRVRDLKGYNKYREMNPDLELENKPSIVIFIDELADLMIAAPAEVEDSIQRIAQMGRAAGIHLVVATQRPSVDVITGVIKANMSSRIALTVKSQIDSRTIIDQGGAEKLTGHGDMLYDPVDFAKPLRVQGCYLSDKEIQDVVKFLKDDNGEAQYSSDIEEQIIKSIPQGKKKANDFDSDSSSGGLEGISEDEKFREVVDFILANPDQVSISSLQRHLRIGFARAGRLIDELLEKGFIQNVDGSKTKKVVITQNEWYEMLATSSSANASKPVQPSMFDRSAGDDIFINPDTVTNVTDEDMGFSGGN